MLNSQLPGTTACILDSPHTLLHCLCTTGKGSAACQQKQQGSSQEGADSVTAAASSRTSHAGTL